LRFSPYQRKKRGAIFRLTDEYSNFYLKWIKNVSENVLSDPDSMYWQSMSDSQSWKSWAGYTFENICLKHIPIIKKTIGIGSVITADGPWRYIASEHNHSGKGVQIDLVIDRNDRIISICEMKYYSGEFTIAKQYAKELETKIQVFKEQTKTSKPIFLVIVTTHGVKKNKYFDQIVSNVVTLKDLLQ